MEHKIQNKTKKQRQLKPLGFFSDFILVKIPTFFSNQTTFYTLGLADCFHVSLCHSHIHSYLPVFLTAKNLPCSQKFQAHLSIREMLWCNSSHNYSYLSVLRLNSSLNTILLEDLLCSMFLKSRVFICRCLINFNFQNYIPFYSYLFGTLFCVF